MSVMCDAYLHHHYICTNSQKNTRHMRCRRDRCCSRRRSCASSSERAALSDCWFRGHHFFLSPTGCGLRQLIRRVVSGTRLRSIWARPRCRNRRYASTAVLATRRASAEDRPAFQEADHLLDSASARSMAAAVQRSDRQVDHALACWEDHVRGERLDRGVASLDFQGSRTWAPIFSSNLRCRRPRSRCRR
jgi:hypothetical protein